MSKLVFSYKPCVRSLLRTMLFCFFLPVVSFARPAGDNGEEPAYEEVGIFLDVTGLGTREVEAAIRNQEIYLSVKDVFDFLRIRNRQSSELDSVTGFISDEKSVYVIDKPNNRILLGKKTFPLNTGDLILSPMGLYLKSTVFSTVFGLDCQFNFRNLSVKLTPKFEVPAIRDKRQELLRSNLGKLNREIVADTVIAQRYPALHFGAADWAVVSTQLRGYSNTRLNLNTGAIVAGGETNLSLNYDTHQEFSLRQQYYSWRYANNENSLLRQVTAGKVPIQSVSSLLYPVIGVKLSNTPTSYRRSFGTYTLSDFTEPEWMVELYVNNVLIDYTKADVSGFFTFKVPLVYGNTALKLRFYGPWGEERTSERHITVPYNFLPQKEAEYTVSAGILEDGKQTQFSRGELAYGLTNAVTVGAGAEYLSSLEADNIMPFVNASIRLAPNLLFSGDYTYNVRGRGLLTYRTPADFLFELNYSRYAEKQQAIRHNYLEERKLMISKPFRHRNFYMNSRLTVNQIIYPSARQTVADLLLSAAAGRISANVTTTAYLLGSDYFSVYSNFSSAVRVGRRTILRQQLRYAYRENEVRDIKLELENQIFGRGFLNLTYENNLRHTAHNFGIGLRFDLSFAKASFSARRTGGELVTTQSLRGGSIYDVRHGYMSLNNRVNIGRSGLLISPYLDINANNRRDKGEPRVTGLNLRSGGGRVQAVRDTMIRVTDLEPYTSYLLDFSHSDFENITWQLTDKKYKVVTEPNKLKLVEVPVKVMGEASGMVYGSSADSVGQRRIVINFYRNGKLAGHTISESDGYFSFMGLAPGSYTAAIDTAQLRKLKLTAHPAALPFVLSVSAEGDIAADLNFKLVKPPAKPAGVAEKDRTRGPVSQKSGISGQPQKTIDKRIANPPVESADRRGLFFAITTGRLQGNSIETYKKLISQRLGRSAFVITDKGLLKLQITGFTSPEEADAAHRKLISSGIPAGEITPYRIGAVNLVPAGSE